MEAEIDLIRVNLELFGRDFIESCGRQIGRVEAIPCSNKHLNNFESHKVDLVYLKKSRSHMYTRKFNRIQSIKQGHEKLRVKLCVILVL